MGSFGDLLVGDAPVSACVTTLDGRYVEVDDYVADMAGFDTPAEMIGKKDADCPWQGNDGNERRQLIDEMTKRRGAMTIQNWCQTRYGWRCYTMNQKVITFQGTPYFRFDSIETTQFCPYEAFVRGIDTANRCVHLGPKFDNRHLTDQEIQVLRLRSFGANHYEIAKRTQLSQRQIRSFLERWHLWVAQANLQARRGGETENILITSHLSAFILETVDWFNPL